MNFARRPGKAPPPPPPSDTERLNTKFTLTCQTCGCPGTFYFDRGHAYSECTVDLPRVSFGCESCGPTKDLIFE